MASIDIFPLSIGGVSPPLNLLSTIFSPNPTGSKYLSYPLDLAVNPTFAHAIQFSVYDYHYPGLESATESLKNFGESVWGAAQTVATGKIKEQDLTNLKPKIQALSESVGAAQGQNWKAVTLGAPRAVMSLYMPDTLNTTYDSNYTAVQMYDVLGLGNLVANVLGDSQLKNTSWNNPTDAINAISKNANMRELMAIGGGRVMNAFGGNGGELTGALRQAFQQIPNPQMQMTYKGINLREFQFEFLFTPISAREAQTVDTIIRRFIYYSVPALMGTDQGGQYLQPPQIFKINFAYTGGNTVSNALTNVFQNTLTNVFGAQLSGLIGPNGLNKTQPDATSMNGSKLFTIGDCVLTNVMVDYAPNGWAAYSDGYPVQTRMTLQFKEMDIVTKDKVDPVQWASDPNNTNYGGGQAQAVSEFEQNHPNNTYNFLNQV